MQMCRWNGRCKSDARLDGKTILVTGCNTGIGKCAVEDFYKRGARVIMACRDCKKATAARDDIQRMWTGYQNLGELVVTELDLASLDSVRKCAKHILQTEPKLHILINNAGIMACPKAKTKDGFDMQFGTNHLGPFLLTLLLLPILNESKPARILVLTSIAHLVGKIDFNDPNFEKKKYSASDSYAQSKLANILFAQELALRLRENKIEGITTYAIHPGVINTDLGRNLDDAYFCGMRTFFNMVAYLIKSPEQGTQTTLYCAIDEDVANESGLYYNECTATTPFWSARDPEKGRKLFDLSLKLVGLGEDYNPFNFGPVAPLFVTRTVELALATIPIEDAETE